MFEYEHRITKPITINPGSPTASDMLGINDYLCMIKSNKKFEPECKYLDKQFSTPVIASSL